MAWLFGQTWFWCLIAFIVGALIAWLLTILMFPHERDAVKDDDVATEGGRS